MNEILCTICLDRLSTKNTVVLRSCKHEFCFKCIQDLVAHHAGTTDGPPYLIRCPICNKRYLVGQDIREIVHPVINLMHDPVDLTVEVIDLTNA